MRNVGCPNSRIEFLKRDLTDNAVSGITFQNNRLEVVNCHERCRDAAFPALVKPEIAP
jgi:hypothetical protein